MNIRKLETKDFEQVREIDDLTLKGHFDNEWSNYDEEEKDKYRKSRKSEFEINVKTGYSFVIEEDDKILGFIFAYETLPFKGTVHVHHIAVHPKSQSKGIGEKLFRRLIDEAKTNGIKKISSGTNTYNKASIKLHEKLGFDLVDRKNAYLKLS